MLWYEDDVLQLEKEKGKLSYEPEMVFYGSSSIRQWDTLCEDFEAYKPVNLGFGGSTLAACVWFFDRIVGLYHPKSIIIYAGDNDLGDGRHPEEVFIFFLQMLAMIKERFGDIPCAYISIKPSISRANILENIRYANTLIEAEIKRRGGALHYIDVFSRMIDSGGHPNGEFLDTDGLHLNEKGYTLWREVVQQYVAASFHEERIP
jgi:hypothetical protein